jgi:uncharacterized protein YyaL (SSP411 family)
VEGLLTLYEATFEQRWFEEARVVADTMIDRFGDSDRGGFFSTAADAAELIVRRKEIGDHPIPAGNSSAALGLLRLAALTGERSYEHRAVDVLRLFHAAAVRHPESFGHLLRALDFHLSPSREVALVAPPGAPDPVSSVAELAVVVRSAHRPHLVLAAGPEGTETPELMRGRTAVEGRAAAYVCENFTCRMPVTEPDQLKGELDGRD